MTDIAGVAAVLSGGASACQQRAAPGAVPGILAQQVMLPPLGGAAGRAAEQALPPAGKRVNRRAAVSALGRRARLSPVLPRSVPAAEGFDGIRGKPQLFADLAVGHMLLPVVEDQRLLFLCHVRPSFPK